MAQEAVSFLRHIYSTFPKPWVEIRRINTGAMSRMANVFEGDELEKLLDDMSLDTELCFSVHPRSQGTREPTPNTSFVFIDLDGSTYSGECSARVNSGGPGRQHVYWILNCPYHSDITTRLKALAVTLFNGDPKCLDVTRVMRLPGAYNSKHDTHASLVALHDNVYTPDQLEGVLLGTYLARHMKPGSRHTVTLAFAGWAALASVPKNIALRAVLTASTLSNDNEDRSKNVATTYDKRANGEPVSGKEFIETFSRAHRKQLATIYSIRLNQSEIAHSEDGVLGVYADANELEDMLIHAIQASGRLVSYGGLDYWWDGQQWYNLQGNAATLVYPVEEYVRQCTVATSTQQARLVPSSKTINNIAGRMKGRQRVVDDDSRSKYFYFNNGVLNLETGEFKSASREDYAFQSVGYEYDPHAKSEALDRYLNIFDDETREFVIRWGGYILKPRNVLQKLLWIYGREGSGKSTLVDIFSMVFGSLACAFSLRGNPEYMMARIHGMRLITTAEFSGLLYTSALKQITGGDIVSARHPYGRPFSVRPYAHVIVATNNLPPVDDMAGLPRRLVLLPMTGSVVPDANLRDALHSQRSGIFNMFYRYYMRDGALELPLIPHRSTQALENFINAENHVQAWCRENLVLASDGVVSISALFEEYRVHAGNLGLKVRLSPEFAEQIIQWGNGSIQNSGNTLLGVKTKISQLLAL